MKKINLFQFQQSLMRYNKRIMVKTNSKKRQLIIKNKPSLNFNTSIQKNNHLSYRPDIDGLRTVAVCIVIVFHAWPNMLTGGLIGVDVFFAISGYLISGIIIKKCRKNSFSFIDFYSRRIRRIYPALLCILFFVLIIAMSKLLAR